MYNQAECYAAVSQVAALKMLKENREIEPTVYKKQYQTPGQCCVPSAEAETVPVAASVSGSSVGALNICQIGFLQFYFGARPSKTPAPYEPGL